MKETQIIKGEYRHIEGHRYSVLGIAQRIDDLTSIANRRPTEIGTALSVAGYEETEEVSGNQIQVFRVIVAGEGNDSELVFTKLGQFETPDKVVVYIQLEKEKYPAGQLWWRPIENFQRYFSLVKELLNQYK